MLAQRHDHQIRYFIFAIVLMISFAPAIGSADMRLPVGPLPEPLISEEQCLNADLNGWGWDGVQSCYITTLRFYGASFALTQTRRDFGGNALVWNRDDLADKTVRCDNYRRSFLSTADTSNGYIRDRYDITFLTQDTLPINASDENLSDITAHLYTRGWEIDRFGQLNSGLLVNFNGYGISTEKGYIFVSASTTSSDSDRIVDRFSHCYLRDEDTIFRASGYCVDHDGDGIGWNGGETCDVKPVDANCDYSNAYIESNHGWGYNTVTGRSCPPTGNSSNNIPEDRCTYIQQDGWGWNEFRQQSCRDDE